MKLRYTLTLLLAIVFASTVNAQDYLPFATSNYAGITGVHLQPASIVDSRYKADIQLFGLNVDFSNNYMGFDTKYLWDIQSIQDDWENTDLLIRDLNGKDKSAFLSARADVFGLMLNLSPKDAIGITAGVRSITNLDRMTEDLATIIDNGLDVSDLWYAQLHNANISIQTNTWSDIGLTYARVIKSEGKHFLKVGGTMKVAFGLASAYGFVEDLTYKFDTSDTLELFQSHVNYGTSENFDLNFENMQKALDIETNPSLVFDAGVVYEYRPDFEEFKYEMDGKKDIWRSDKNKYLFRVGLSITDIGKIKYSRNPQSRDFNANIQNWYVGDLGLLQMSIDELNDTIASHFEYFDVPTTYNMNLPTTISAQFDVRAVNNIYFNVTPYYALMRGSKDQNKVHYLSAISFGPRFDSKWLGVSVPFSYNSMGQFKAGFGLRLGPLWVGSNSLFSSLAGNRNIKGTDFSFALKVPILHGRPHDKDKDMVSDRKDKCPKIPGTWELKGCPDSDGDGITDSEDKCPNFAGPKEYAGCPDADGDGVYDMDDKCPNDRGTAEMGGCPDADGDGIVDNIDACPNNAGPESLNGCPDQDGDLIPDKEDMCPTLAGTRENNGCPFIDTDGDGVKDSEDRCPGEAGPVANQGCPYSDVDGDGIPDKDDECPTVIGTAIFMGCPDTDGDGISDKNDLCPTIPGVAENKGCPEIKKEEQAILNKAFDNLEFETGKSVIKSSSTGSLNELAELMKQKPEWKLRLAGHTDNVGKPESNMKLSQNRTQAVKKYLVSKGVPDNKIIAEWYGQTKPVSDNTTPEGRQRNRRVEMTIVFE